MNNFRSLVLQITIVSCLFVLASQVFAVKAPSSPLEQRVHAASTIFVGELINKKLDGDWICADLLVVEVLYNAIQSDTVAVTWRATIDGRPIYDTAENSQGVAILRDKRNGSYWLRSDKFVPLSKLEEIKKLVGDTQSD